MLSELEAPHTYYLVAEVEDQVVGYAGLSQLVGATQADIQTIAVRPNQRGSGLGRALMQELTKEATRRGAKEVFLEVRADNTIAQKLYKMFGFKPHYRTIVCVPTQQNEFRGV
jgi:N6-L-threonylcarbamoyladenine synthase/ribosomal-protein-alanine N-acetyltransferase